MERKTYIVTVDEKSSCVGVMPAFGNSRYDKVTITKPVSVTALDGYPKLYTSEVLDKERQAGEQAGQNEAWELAQKILELPCKGGYTPEELIDIFGNDAVPFVHDLIRRYTFHEVVAKIQKWRGQPKRFDIVKVQFGNDEKEAIITRVEDDYVNLMFRGGGTCRRFIDAVTKTGRTLEYGLTKWVKGE